MTFPQARSHGKTLPSEANSVATEKRAANASRSRASARRRETILDAALAVAAAGGYEAVQMRTVAERVGIAVGTLYRYFPAKTHLLVAALTREFRRLDSAGDWASGEGPPLQRLERLTAHLHDRWQRDPRLTTAMTRAFAVADTRAAAELDRQNDRVALLAPGGRLVLPVGTDQQYLSFIEHTPQGYVETRLDAVRFVPLLSGTQ